MRGSENIGASNRETLLDAHKQTKKGLPDTKKEGKKTKRKRTNKNAKKAANRRERDGMEKLRLIRSRR
jgi:hypothetical protein